MSHPKLKVMVGQWEGELAVTAPQLTGGWQKEPLLYKVGLVEGKWDMQQVERLGCELTWGTSGSESKDTELRRKLSTRI